MAKRHIDIIKAKYVVHWRHTLQHSKKLEFYSIFESDYTPSVHPDLTSKATACEKLFYRPPQTQHRDRWILRYIEV